MQNEGLHFNAILCFPPVNPVKEKKERKAEKGSRQMSKRLCRVTYLEGHSDIITSLVIVKGKVVTARWINYFIYDCLKKLNDCCVIIFLISIYIFINIRYFYI